MQDAGLDASCSGTWNQRGAPKVISLGTPLILHTSRHWELLERKAWVSCGRRCWKEAQFLLDTSWGEGRGYT